jgi:peptidyl-dipeptidase A
MSFSRSKLGSAALLAPMSAICVLWLGGCSEPQRPAASAPPANKAPTAEDAAKFIAAAEAELRTVGEEAARTSWVYNTYINYDTEWLAAKMRERTTELGVRYAAEAHNYDGVNVPADQRRKLDLLKLGVTLPAPRRAGAARELAEITTRLSSHYSTGKIQFDGRTVSQNETEVLMRTLTDPAKLADVWTEWHDTAAASKADYARMVEIANEGATGLGYANVGAMWRSGYDMTPDAFAAEVDRLWGQVKPLYDSLHCFVRAALNKKYGDAVVPLDQPIRADLLGNMWAQEWGPIYPRLAPAGADAGIDLNKRLTAAKYDARRLVKTGEAFYTSLGFAPLPDTFWERSLIVKPADREVVCHASAWDLDSEQDVRIKMCIDVGEEDFRVVHHELGHNFYQRAYRNQPPLFQGGANDGFHEAIGDMVALSITPEYLKQIGLTDTVPDASKDIGLLLKRGLDSVAFLPFGLLVDKWRWQVFAGELTPATYNEGWWKLRTQYQGVRPVAERPPEAFDAAAKFHVASNVPYMRYFLARILQFQFYKAACDQVGWKGPLHRCSFYGAKDAGAKFNAMLEMGASRPWPDALEAFTGTREMDGSAIVAYFAPLKDWLDERNKGRVCGW